MTMRNVIGVGAASFMLLSGGTGCVHRELLEFEDHGTKPLTGMRVQVDSTYFFWNSHEYVFYSWAEQGDKLTCKRLCGGSTDLECPSVRGNGYYAKTNIE